MKRRSTKDQAGNFRAGYVHIDEEHLHKTGIRGRKVYVVYAIIIALTLIAVVNILVSSVPIYMLENVCKLSFTFGSSGNLLFDTQGSFCVCAQPVRDAVTM